MILAVDLQSLYMEIHLMDAFVPDSSALSTTLLYYACTDEWDHAVDSLNECEFRELYVLLYCCSQLTQGLLLRVTIARASQQLK